MHTSPLPPVRRTTAAALPLLFALFVICLQPLQAQRVAVHARILLPDQQSGGSIVDIGPAPASEPVNLTLHLAIPADRSAALDQFLSTAQDPTSAQYHKWLSPHDFGATYGAPDAQSKAVLDWLKSQGIAANLSASQTRITLSAPAERIQKTFAISLRHYSYKQSTYTAAAVSPTVSPEVSSAIASIDGLNPIPVSGSFTISGLAVSGKNSSLANQTSADNLASLIDSNVTDVIAVDTHDCTSTSVAQEGMGDLLRQANAQGITIVESSACSTPTAGEVPSDAVELTSTVSSGNTPPQPASQLARPAWQSAPGLPDDGLRAYPDFATPDTQALARTLLSVVQKTGTREGNINPRIYQLAPTPGLFTQADNSPAGTWEPSSGLGTVNLEKLLTLLPRATGTLGTTTSLSSTAYAVGYGQTFTLSATVAPSGTVGATQPTGMVTFSTASQGVLGTAALVAGTASLTVSNPLSVGTYSISANYAGDATYAPGSSPSVSVTVSAVTANITGSISPASGLPYGTTATATATVVLPNSSIPPAGPVTAAVEGITGAVYTGTLAPNPGQSSATANIIVAAPPPGTYTVQLACAGNANFQCQSPANLTLSTIQGKSVTTVQVTPTAPQAGQPSMVTALISNAGNGPGPYSFTGNVIFYDNGKQIATSPVSSNQASTSATFSGVSVHNITATYSGDSNWTGSTSVATALSPTLLPATVSLTSDVSSTLAGANVVFTAVVYTTVNNTVGPTGTVSIFDTSNGSLVQLGGPGGAISLVANGPNQAIARFTTTGLMAGSHSLYAVYNGDANFAAATSSTLAINVSDYNLTFVPQTLTLSRGQKGQTVAILGLVGGFTGTVTLGCTPPAGTETTCSFSPVTLTGGGTSTMTILTSAPQDRTSHPSTTGSKRGGMAVAGGAAALMLGLFLPRRRRMLPFMLVTLLALSLSSGLGCSAGILALSGSGTTAGQPSDPGTPLGTQMFTITSAGTDNVNTVRHNYQFQVTIQ